MWFVVCGLGFAVWVLGFGFQVSFLGFGVKGWTALSSVILCKATLVWIVLKVAMSLE